MIRRSLDASVYNPLDEYSRALDEWAKPNQLETVRIILSLKEERGGSEFVCITYKQFFDKIRELLGTYASTSSQKWLLYLVDFMHTVENLKKGTDMDLTEMDRFFIKNETRLGKLISDYDQFQSKLNRRVADLKTLMDKEVLEENVKRRRIWSNSCLVLDLDLSGNSIAFDTSIFPNGWELELFGRNKNSQSYLSRLFDIYPMKEQRIDSMHGHRFVLKKYDLLIDLVEIKTDLLGWLDLLTQSYRNLQNEQ